MRLLGLITLLALLALLSIPWWPKAQYNVKIEEPIAWPSGIVFTTEVYDSNSMHATVDLVRGRGQKRADVEFLAKPGEWGDVLALEGEVR